MKKIALLTFGITDDFCHPDSKFRIPKSDILFEKITASLKENGLPDVIVDITPYGHVHETIDILKKFSNVKSIELTHIDKNSILSVENYFDIKELDSTNKKRINGSNFDFIITPDEYDIYVSGIDFNGSFIKILPELISLGYRITVLSDMSRLYNKNTATFFEANNIRFCSYSSAMRKAHR